jgi:hypothetical protein
MRSWIRLILLGFISLGSGSLTLPADEVELVCVKKHNATQTCHYNFRINGINYRYLDNGCKGKKEQVLQRAREGKLALARDWKVDCPAPKPAGQ